MISRKLHLLDRVAGLLLAAVLIAAGLLGIWWWTDTSPLADRTDTAPLARVVDMDWFPWASCVLGVVLVVLALRWLAAHVRRTGVKELYLTGSGPAGTLLVDGGKVADAAAEALTDVLGVTGASGSITRDRGQIVAALTAHLDRTADLVAVARQADLVSGQLRQVLGRDDIHCRVELKATPKVAGLMHKIPGVD